MPRLEDQAQLELGPKGANWPAQLQQVLAREPCVVVTMRLILGSAPRESGCRMIVTADGFYGSIGGGNLEYTAIQKARAMLRQSAISRQMHQPCGLGPALNQCCGGAVTLHFEVFCGDCPHWVTDLAAIDQGARPAVLVMAIDRAQPLRVLLRQDEQPGALVPRQVWEAAQQLLPGTLPAAADSAGEAGGTQAVITLEADGETWWLQRQAPRLQPLMLFGAGHVGRRVASLLCDLPFELTWVDSRSDVFPAMIAANLRIVRTDEPVRQVATAAAGSIFVIMTHSHQLDEDICFEVLRRGDFCWLGLIGSETKRRRFVQRLNNRGIATDLLQRLICPVGLAGIRGKQPATIALSLAAQLMMEKPWMNVND